MILNFTQHDATDEQIADGVVDFAEEHKRQISILLTFAPPTPSINKIRSRAKLAARWVRQHAPDTKMFKKVMIGGAPFFMTPLGLALEKEGFVPVFAFSKRESMEEALPGGGICKKQVFRHLGFAPFVTDLEKKGLFDADEN